MVEKSFRTWTPSDAAELYEVASWGKHYFSVNPRGHVSVHPTKDPRLAIDLKLLVDRLVGQGARAPMLIRFGDLLKHRLAEIHAAFDLAMKDHDYRGGYRCIYPIKVNQQCQVVEEVLRFGQPHRSGLEVGSKPELMAVVAMASNDVPIICNGFKDESFMRTALAAQKIGRTVFLVLEKRTDFDRVLDTADRLAVRPRIGIRLKLAAAGSGRWQSSGGPRSKFGLTTTEVLRVVDRLKTLHMEDCLELLHFHLGSQITNIRFIKQALNEAARFYVELIRRGARLKYLDVGGGLGVDYDGSQTVFDSSANYTLQEYANDVVFHIQSVCDETGVEHPTIFSESGRAVAAYHSVLVFDVLDDSNRGNGDVLLDLPEHAGKPLVDLCDTYRDLNHRNLLESYHDAQQALEMAVTLFGSGHLPLEQRSESEKLFWGICRKIRRLAGQLDYVPEELEGLDAMLCETYFCNFSLFQSLPDSWAIKHLFPIMPIHRLRERPDELAVLADMTCDSDGRIDRFVNRRELKRTLPVHSLDGSPYYLGVFLVGAYQEILGDLHNLFGDTNAVHVTLDAEGEPAVEKVIAGDSIREVLQYVQYDPQALLDQLKAAVQQAVQNGRMDASSAERLLHDYEADLERYTYLNLEL